MSDGSRPGPLPAWLAPVGAIARPMYDRVVARRNASFDAGRRVITLDRPVISVGNLCVGGTGKTPVVCRVVDELLTLGRTPAIAMRGYRSRGGVSDEADLYARRFPVVPVVARPNRLDGLIDLFATEEGRAVDVVVLDDGFQHRRINRQLDIVLVSAVQRSPFEDATLPGGWLREPVTSLRRASLVVITHADRVQASLVDAIRRRCREENADAPVAAARHRWVSLDVWAGGGDTNHPIEDLRRRRVVLVCGVGSPGPVIEAIEAAGATIARRLVFPDHAAYSARTVRRIVHATRRTRADAVVCTDKDWSKLRRFAWPDVPIIRPKLEIEFQAEEHAVTRLLAHTASLRGDDLDPVWSREGAVEPEDDRYR